MKTRRTRLAIAVTAGIAILLAAIVLARMSIAERAARLYFNQLGIQDAALQVVGLNFHGVRIRGLKLGAALGARRIDVDYDILAARVTAVRAEGLNLAAAYGPEGLDLGPLTPFAETGGGNGAASGPEIALSDIALSLRTGNGLATIALPGNVRIGETGAASVDSAFRFEHPALSARGEIELRQSAGGTFVRLTGDAPDLDASFAVEGDDAGRPGGDGLQLSVRLLARDAARLGRLFPATGISGGRAELVATYAGSAPLGGSPGTNAEGTLTTRLSTSLAGEGAPFAALTATIDATTVLDGARADTVIDTAEISASGLDPATLKSFAGRLPDIRKLDLVLAEGYRITVEEPLAALAGGLPGAVVLSGDARLTGGDGMQLAYSGELALADAVTADGRLEGSAPWLSLGGVRAEDLSLQGRVRIDGDARGTGLTLSDANLSAGSVRPPEGSVPPGPVAVTVASARATLGPCGIDRCSALQGPVKGEADFGLRHPLLGAKGHLSGARTGEDMELAARIGEIDYADGDSRRSIEPKTLLLEGEMKGGAVSARLAAEVPELGLDAHGELAAPDPAQDAELSLDLAAADVGKLTPLFPDLPLRAGAGRLTLAYRGTLPGISGTAEKIAGSGEMKLELHDAKAAGGALGALRLAAPFRIEGGDKESAVDLSGGSLEIQDAALAGGVRLAGPSRVAIDRARLTLGPCTPAACSPAPRAAETVLSADTLTVDAPAAPGPVHLTGGRAAVRADLSDGLGRLTTDIAAEAVQAEGAAHIRKLSMKGAVDLRGGRLDQKIAVASIAALAGQASKAPPVKLDGRVSGPIGHPRFGGRLTTLSGPEVAADLVADPETARITLPPTHAGVVLDALRPFGGPQLAGLAAGGRVEGEIVLPLGDPAGGSASVGLSDVSLRSEDAAADGIEGTIRLSSLVPLATSEPQTLRIARLDAGAPLTDITARFRLANRDGAPVMAFETLTGGMMGGAFAFEPFEVAAPPGPVALRLNLTDIDLAQLTGLLGLGSISLDGRLSGVVPVSIDGAEKVAIDNAQLSGGTNGVVRIGTQRARDLIGKRGGEDVDLMLRALQNFHYDTLEVGIDKRQEGDAEIRIRLEGRNPEVLEGRPFIFNVNVQGNADRLAETILTVYRASSGVIQTGVRSLK